MEQLELLVGDKDETIRRRDVIVTSLEASLAESRDLAAASERALAAKVKELESAAEQQRQTLAAGRETERRLASAEESISEKERLLEERSRRVVELEADNKELGSSVASLTSRLQETRLQLDGATADRRRLQNDLERTERSLEHLRAETRTAGRDLVRERPTTCD